MTLTRRQTLIGAAATVAAAALPAVAVESISRRTHLRIGHSRFGFDAGIGDWYAEIGSKKAWEMTRHGWKFLWDWEPAS